MEEQRPVVKIHSVEIITSSGRAESYPVGSHMVYIYQTEEGVTVASDPPAESTLQWQLQAVAHDRSCQIINHRTNPALQLNWDEAESDTGTMLETNQPLDKQSAEVEYERTLWINQKVGLIFYSRAKASSTKRGSIQVQLWPDGGIELTEKHTKAPESSDHQDHPLRWLIRLRHAGRTDQTVQFHLVANVDRLPSAAYRLDTLHPKLSLVNDQNVTLTFFQSLEEPIEAGVYRIEIRAEADEYPGEMAQDFQLLKVLPFYRYELGFEDDSARTDL